MNNAANKADGGFTVTIHELLDEKWRFGVMQYY